MISQENVNIQPVSLQYLYVETANQQISGSWFRASAITTTNKIQQDAQ
jgi:hypothetical protein